MTLHSKREAVKVKIIEAVPSVMDLKRGCHIITDRGEAVVYLSNREVTESVELNPKSDTWACNEPTDKIKPHEIIGRPITLADVLIAIGKSKHWMETWSITYTGKFFKIDEVGTGDGNKDFYKRGYWDLSQDYDYQSEECIEFLWELL